MTRLRFYRSAEKRLERERERDRERERADGKGILEIEREKEMERNTIDLVVTEETHKNDASSFVRVVHTGETDG